jgi:hypothetical protein
MAWSTPRTWATLEAVTAANMNTYVSDDLSWLGIDRPHCQVRDGSFSPSAGTWSSPSWDSITTNVGAMATSGNGYITATSAGFWLVGASCVFTQDSTAGARAIMLSSSANGAGTVYAQANTTQHSGNDSGASVATMVQLSANAPVYASLFRSGTAAITNIRMWAIWMTA